MTKSVAKEGKVKAGAKKKRGSRKPTFTEQARRKQILEVSSLLFRSKGFNRTSLEDIAREVGVSRGVIFFTILTASVSLLRRQYARACANTAITCGTGSVKKGPAKPSYLNSSMPVSIISMTTARFICFTQIWSGVLAMPMTGTH